MEIKVGDVVSVRSLGGRYSLYKDFFEENKKKIIEDDLDLAYIARWENDDNNYIAPLRDEDLCVKVLFIGKHNDGYTDVALVIPLNKYNREEGGKTILISMSYLIPRKDMTIEEIEKELGYKINIVK